MGWLTNFFRKSPRDLVAQPTAGRKLNLAGTIDLGFGFAVSMAATLQSGFPIAVSQAAQNSGLLGGSQRPNVVPNLSPVLTSDRADAFDPGCACIKWLNPAAWSDAPAFTLGTAPRADGRARDRHD